MRLLRFSKKQTLNELNGVVSNSYTPEKDSFLNRKRFYFKSFPVPTSKTNSMNQVDDAPHPHTTKCLWESSIVALLVLRLSLSFLGRLANFTITYDGTLS